MKVTGTKKSATNQEKDVRQPAGNCLKSAMVTTKTSARKEVYVPKSSVHRYAELPSLRYGATPTPTAIQMMGSGPLRVVESNGFVGQSKAHCAKRSKSFDGRLCDDGRVGNYCGIRSNFQNFSGEAPPTVRRVHFAELPPKFNREVGEGKVGDEEGKVEKEEGMENRMRNRVGIPSTDGNSVSSNPRFERHCLASSASFPPLTRLDGLRLGNNGAVQGGTVLANKHVSRGHDTARYRHGTLTHLAAATPTPTLPLLLRAARDGSEDELLDTIRRAAHFGISAEELNAADNSGRTLVFEIGMKKFLKRIQAYKRTVFLEGGLFDSSRHPSTTALSYIASNGELKTLEAILRLPGIDVNKQDNEGNTPLHFAAQAGQVESVSYMVSTCHGLDIDARNTLGFTPLMKAALQGRTKCAKVLLCAGASPVMRDSGRGLRAEQWARYCGRHMCADVIEKFSRSKVLDRNGDYSRWGSEPELAARIFGGKNPLSHSSQSTASTSFKSKLRKAFRSTSNPGESCSKSFSVVSHLTSAALCVSSPLLPSSPNVPSGAKSLLRPLAVPKVQVTLAAANVVDDSNPCASDQISRERPVTSRPSGSSKKKQ